MVRFFFVIGPSLDAYAHLIDRALIEDVGSGDVTSLSVVPKDCLASARMIARQALVVAGLDVVREVFRRVDIALAVSMRVKDGDSLPKGAEILSVAGLARSILSSERVALNFAQRLCGIASLTCAYVKELEGLPCEILDTRKTTPGWRVLEKYAVVCGGGRNHRAGLFDMAMIKDNHLAVLEGSQKQRIAEAVARVKAVRPDLRVEVEADTVEQALYAAEAGADAVLLDNMNILDLRRAVEAVAGRAKTEASGGITLDNLRAIALTGVDFISVGSLTHSAPAADIALDIAKVR